MTPAGKHSVDSCDPQLLGHLKQLAGSRARAHHAAVPLAAQTPRIAVTGALSNPQPPASPALRFIVVRMYKTGTRGYGAVLLTSHSYFSPASFHSPEAKTCVTQPPCCEAPPTAWNEPCRY